MKTIKLPDTRKMVLLALLTAIVVVLQVLASAIPVYPFRLTLVLVPIVIGAALITPLAGGWLGFVFGFVVLVSSGDVLPFMLFNPAATIFVLLLKGVLAGMAAGYVYKLFANKNRTMAVISAAVIAPIVNTGIFVLGAYVFFLPVVMEFGGFFGYSEATAIIFLGMVGINFPLEFGTNLILSPVIVRLIQYGRDKRMSPIPTL